MLTPSQVTFSLPTIDTSECERDFDRAIDVASTSGQWPAVVRDTRDGQSPEQIRATIAAYRTAGWRVAEGAGDVRARIWHPSHPDATRERPGQGD